MDIAKLFVCRSSDALQQLRFFHLIGPDCIAYKRVG